MTARRRFGAESNVLGPSHCDIAPSGRRDTPVQTGCVSKHSSEPFLATSFALRERVL